MKKNPRNKGSSPLSTFTLLPFLMLFSIICHGHNGVDHGNDKIEAQIHLTAEPRFTSRTERTEVVGVVNGDIIEIFIDDAKSNTPLSFEEVIVESSKQSFSAQKVSEGRYQIPANWLEAGKHYSLLLTLISDKQRDLVASELIMAPASDGTVQSGSGVMPSRAAMWLVIGMLAIFSLWLIRSGLPRRRHTRITFDLAVAACITVGTSIVLYNNPTNAQTGSPLSGNDADRPGLEQQVRKLADGSLYIPKPAQRKLGIRTTVPEMEPKHHFVTLPGKVIANPSSSANVVSPLNGTLTPPDDGFPKPGQRVEKGQILAYLTPILPPGEIAANESELAFIERDIYLTQKQIDRLNTQSIVKQDNSILLDIREAEIKGLKKKFQAMRNFFNNRQAIRAPIAGNLSAINVTAGQYASQGNTLFEIIDPQHLWVEVIVYDSEITGHIADANIQRPKGSQISLEYIGTRSRLQGLGYPMLFNISESSHIAPGEIVSVSVSYGDPVPGVTLHSQAVSFDIRGEAVVWEHVSPEYFTPKHIDLTDSPQSATLFIGGTWNDITPVVADGATLLSAIP